MTAIELAIVLLAILAGAVVKGVTGIGFPLIAVPIISIFVSVEDAVVVVALPNLIANALLCGSTIDSRSESRDLPVLLITGGLGAVIGVVALVTVPEEPILLALVITVLTYVIVQLFHPDLRLSRAASRRWAPVAGLTAGVMQGSVGIPGPVLATWLHSYKLPKNAFVFSVTAIFVVAGAVQIGLIAVSGRYDINRAAASVLAIIPVVAIMPLGMRYRARLAGPTFDRLVLALLAVTSLALIARLVL